MIKMKRLFALAFFLCSVVLSMAQDSTAVASDVNEARRVEVQRYFGYESLPFRYITQPYDATINVNQGGNFVDIGYALFIILPIVLLGFLYRKKKWFFGVSAAMVVYLLLSWSYSKVVIDGVYHSRSDDSWAQVGAAKNKSLTDQILISCYDVAHVVTTPIRSLVEGISGVSTHSTYLLLIVVFLLLLTALFQFKRNPRTLILLVIAAFGFLWLLFSGGIPWYAFLVLPLSILLIGQYRAVSVDEPVMRYMKYLVLGALGFWGLSMYVLRVSNIDLLPREGAELHYGKSLFNGTIFPYSMGRFSEKETIDYGTPNLSVALSRINRDNGLIYMVGTSFAFNIKNADKRIFSDNLLMQFDQLKKMYPNRELFFDALKASNFNYLVIDLHTPTLDKTPEKSLTEKYRQLLRYCYGNERIRPVATDRVMEVKGNDGQTKSATTIFGTKMVNPGSYAVFEIL